ncbi:hypothetical protein ABIA41_001221 [Bradyrhizobium sp. USDA 313]
MTENVATVAHCNLLPGRRLAGRTPGSSMPAEGDYPAPPSLTRPEFVIQHNYSDKDANDTGKRRDR